MRQELHADPRAAIETVGEEELAVLSVRGVEHRPGVGTASLYTHVPGGPSCSSHAGHDARRGPLPHTLPGAWREKVRAWARADWTRTGSTHGCFRLAPTWSTVEPGLVRWYESALRGFAGIGLSEVEAVAVVDSVDGYVRGLVRLMADTEEAQPYSENGAGWNAVQGRFLRDNVDFGRSPGASFWSVDTWCLGGEL